jgi:hypothetical protein
VAAVFDAFLAIYRRRVEDLYRIATSGTGVLPDGELHPDLVNRLASEAAKAANHVLQMCIRALDYCPPVDITFGDYLRAIITADSDLVRDDDFGYRIAFIEAFRRRGIYPRSVRTLSVDSLRWPYAMRGAESTRIESLTEVLKKELGQIRDYATTRQDYFYRSQAVAEKLNELVIGRLSTELEHFVGGVVRLTTSLDGIEVKDGRPVFEIHSVRAAQRVGPDGDKVNHVVVAITQRRERKLDPNDEQSETFLFRGGCTLIFDLDTFKLLYAIGKNIDDDDRLTRQREYMTTGRLGDLWSTYFGKRHLTRPAEPFAILHRSVEDLKP